MLPDNDFLYIVMANNTVHRVNLIDSSVSEVFVKPDPQSPITSIAIIKDRLLVGDTNNDVHQFGLKPSASAIAKCRHHSAPITTIYAPHPPKEDKKVSTFAGLFSNKHQLTPINSEFFFTASEDGVIVVHSRDNFQKISSIQVGAHVTCLEVWRNLLIVGCRDGTIRFWANEKVCGKIKKRRMNERKIKMK